MSTLEILSKFKHIANSPKELFNQYLTENKKVVLCAPLYAPEEIVHSMGMIPMGVWGADMEVVEAKEYFPAFINNVFQTILELGIKGTYKGASAIIIPLLSDNLKALGENWKHAVKDIRYIPMSYPQNRVPKFGIDYTYSLYQNCVKDLEELSGVKFDQEKLAQSIKIYNEHNEVMRRLSKVLGEHPEISVMDRSYIFKSAYFIRKEEHTALVNEFIDSLKTSEVKGKTKLYISGLLFDGPEFLKIFDDLNIHIVGDDMGSESRQYRTDTILTDNPLYALSEKFARTDNCSFLYDVDKKRIDLIVNEVKNSKAEAVLLVLTKFCDSEEFDYVILKQRCEKENIPLLLVEVDRQMVNFEQARTLIQTFVENI